MIDLALIADPQPEARLVAWDLCLERGWCAAPIVEQRHRRSTIHASRAEANGDDGYEAESYARLAVGWELSRSAIRSGDYRCYYEHSFVGVSPNVHAGSRVACSWDRLYVASTTGRY